MLHVSYDYKPLPGVPRVARELPELLWQQMPAVLKAYLPLFLYL